MKNDGPLTVDDFKKKGITPSNIQKPLVTLKESDFESTKQKE